jgi:hypothetical protein
VKTGCFQTKCALVALSAESRGGDRTAGRALGFHGMIIPSSKSFRIYSVVVNWLRLLCQELSL